MAGKKRAPKIEAPEPEVVERPADSLISEVLKDPEFVEAYEAEVGPPARRLTGLELKNQLREERRATRLKEKGY